MKREVYMCSHDCVYLSVWKVTSPLFCLLTINSLERQVSIKNMPLKPFCLGLNSDSTGPPSTWRWASYLASLYPNFFIYKKGLIIFLTSEATMKIT